MHLTTRRASGASATRLSLHGAPGAHWQAVSDGARAGAQGAVAGDEEWWCRCHLGDCRLDAVARNRAVIGRRELAAGPVETPLECAGARGWTDYGGLSRFVGILPLGGVGGAKQRFCSALAAGLRFGLRWCLRGEEANLQGTYGWLDIPV